MSDKTFLAGHFNHAAHDLEKQILARQKREKKTGIRLPAEGPEIRINDARDGWPTYFTTEFQDQARAFNQGVNEQNERARQRGGPAQEGDPYQWHTTPPDPVQRPGCSPAQKAFFLANVPFQRQALYNVDQIGQICYQRFIPPDEAFFKEPGDAMLVEHDDELIRFDEDYVYHFTAGTRNFYVRSASPLVAIIAASAV